jgi:hypothetical protein
MNKLQGVVLPSSERGGIRIEYARSKMADTVRTSTSGTLRNEQQQAISYRKPLREKSHVCGRLNSCRTNLHSLFAQLCEYVVQNLAEARR